MRVAYVPAIANHDLAHDSVEHGRISSKNDHNVFVRFDKNVNNLGWSGATSQSCTPSDLVEMNNDFAMDCRICKTDKYLSLTKLAQTDSGHFCRIECSCCGAFGSSASTPDSAGRLWNIAQITGLPA